MVGFFLKRKEPGVSKWGTIVAPALGAIGLTTGLVFMVKYYEHELADNRGGGRDDRKKGPGSTVTETWPRASRPPGR